MNISQQQELRYQYAGMALQAMITATMIDPKMADIVIEDAKKLGYNCHKTFMAEAAVEYADTLIAELKKTEKNND